MDIVTRLKGIFGMESRQANDVEDALFSSTLMGRSDVGQTAAATAAINSIANSFSVATVTPDLVEDGTQPKLPPGPGPQDFAARERALHD